MAFFDWAEAEGSEAEEHSLEQAVGHEERRLTKLEREFHESEPKKCDAEGAVDVALAKDCRDMED